MLAIADPSRRSAQLDAVYLWKVAEIRGPVCCDNGPSFRDRRCGDDQVVRTSRSAGFVSVREKPSVYLRNRGVIVLNGYDFEYPINEL